MICFPFTILPGQWSFLYLARFPLLCVIIVVISTSLLALFVFIRASLPCNIVTYVLLRLLKRYKEALLICLETTQRSSLLISPSKCEQSCYSIVSLIQNCSTTWIKYHLTVVTCSDSGNSVEIPRRWSWTRSQGVALLNVWITLLYK